MSLIDTIMDSSEREKGIVPGRGAELVFFGRYRRRVLQGLS